MSAQWGISNADCLDIVKFMAQHPYCGVAAPTGSGKSTRLVEAINRIAGNCTVYVVQPTIPAVEELHKKMANELGAEKVGKAADSIVSYNETHKIVYMTSGHMKRKFLSFFRDGKYILKKSFCDVLIIDEAHVGTVDNDAIMALWMKAYTDKCPLPRLLLLSATLDVGTTPFPDAKFFNLKTSSYPVEITYSEKSYHPSERRLYVDTANYVIDEHLARPLSKTDQGESWLVFCAGSYEVGIVTEIINNRKLDKVTTVNAYSEADPTELAKIFQAREAGHRVIIVGTNYIEASITVADAYYVIDSGAEKYGETSNAGGLLLVTESISKSSAMQRAGRAGRTKPGRCHRMYTKEDYEKMAPQRPGEISRVPIHSIVMELLRVGLRPQDIFKGRITDARLAKTIDKLRELEMLDVSNKVTAKGDLAPDLTVSVEGAAILWEWMETGKPLFPAISAVSLIESYGPSYFRYPSKNAENAASHASKVEETYDLHFEKYNTDSDLKSLLKFWNRFLEDLQFCRPDDRAYRKWHRDVNKWCDENSIRRNKMRDCIRNVNLIINTLTRRGKRIDLGCFTPEGCLEVLNPILRNVYKQKLMVQRNGGYFHGEDRYKVDERSPIIRLPHGARPPKLIICLVQTQSKSNNGYVNRIITLSHPIDIDGDVKPFASLLSSSRVCLPRLANGTFSPILSDYSARPAAASTKADAAIRLVSSPALSGNEIAVPMFESDEEEETFDADDLPLPILPQ